MRNNEKVGTIPNPRRVLGNAYDLRRGRRKAQKLTWRQSRQGKSGVEGEAFRAQGARFRPMNQILAALNPVIATCEDPGAHKRFSVWGEADARNSRRNRAKFQPRKPGCRNTIHHLQSTRDIE